MEISHAQTIEFLNSLNWVLEFKTKKMKQKLEAKPEITYEDTQKAERSTVVGILLKKVLDKKSEIDRDKEKDEKEKQEEEDAEREMIRGTKKILGISSHPFRIIQFLRNAFKGISGLTV